MLDFARAADLVDATPEPTAGVRGDGWQPAMLLHDVELGYTATDAVRAALAGLGRTEDVRFSPSNRFLAIPGFERDSLGIVGVDVTTTAGRPEVGITGVVELAPPGLRDPHGVDFVDDTTIVVVNRHGDVTVVRVDLPDEGIEGATSTPIELPAAAAFALMAGPSALAVTRRTDGGHEVLIGHRYRGVLTRHLLHEDGSGRFTVTANDVLLDRGIVVVDGVTVSPDGTWLALSNPMHQTVELHRRDGPLDGSSVPRCILRGASYPHGLRFTPDGRHLFVADGSSPFVHVHARAGDEWRGVRYPAASIRVMSDEVFRRGRCNARDGGPKGVDLDGSGAVLAVTSEFERLVFLDVAAIVDRIAECPEDHDASVRYELDLARDADERVEERIGRLRSSTTYRFAERLQRLRTLATRRR